MTYVLLDSATARVEAPGVSVNDLDARVLVDGDEVGSCHRQLAHKGVDCKLGDYGLELSEHARVELIIDANGRVVFAHYGNHCADSLAAADIVNAWRAPQRSAATPRVAVLMDLMAMGAAL